MRTCRRAYALMEVLVMIAALVLLMALSVEPMRTVLAEVPRMDKNYQGWILTMDLLDTLRQDIETASAIQLSERTGEDGAYSLILQTSSGTVNYELADEHAVRKLAQSGQAPSEWALPHNCLRLNAWSGDAGVYAVEVTTWIEQQAGSSVHKNYEQTHVFFRKTL